LWVKKTTEGYPGVHVENFKTGFKDGLAFLALCDKFVGNPELVDYSKFDKNNATDNLTSGFEYAEKHLGVPKLLEADELTSGNVDERSLVLYVSLFFHAFTAHEQQLAMKAEKDMIDQRLKGLQGSLEERARLATELQEENRKMREELEELKAQLKTERDAKNELAEKDTYLEEKVDVLKALLDQENQEKETIEKELEELRAKLAARDAEMENERKRYGQLNDNKSTLEQQVQQLLGQVADLTQKLKQETAERNREKELREKHAKVELKGMEVLRKNLDEHVEDLNRWMKYLDYDTQSELDFGEVRAQIFASVTKENFDEQLERLATKLGKENDEILSFLKQKEAEAKVKKANEKKKKERQIKADE